ncbi:cysteine protease [Agromyces rhizosphaerae]|uniref:Cysteine protease n=1 Tax=Agromyces rhizosphaerae TaxID=88374 RepID=A0A9W6CTC7_9MICO|nr:transglutaminaseTgpA domain-containing protein [Agromyces rhizosphaerae]GLI25962.1 cysteine protease [Agromyces rhizosphaerae]
MSEAGTMRRPVRWWVFPLLGLAVAAAAVPWWPIHETRHLLVVVAAAALAGFAVAGIGAVRSWPAWAVLLGCFAAYLLLGVPLAVPGAAAGLLPTPAGIVELLAGTAVSWPRLLTIVLPVGTYQALLVPVFVSTLAASAASVSIALRSRRPALAVLPPVAMFLAGILLGPRESAWGIVGGAGMVAACLAWLVAVRRLPESAGSPRRAVSVRRVLGGLAVGIVAVLAGTGAAVVLAPGTEREVVRAYVQQPFDPRETDSPLAGFRAWHRTDRAGDPMLVVRGLPPGERLRLAVLDTWDGIVFSVGGPDGAEASGSFTRLPYRLDQDAPAGGMREVDVRILGYEGVWLPGVGRIESIAFSGERAEPLGATFFYNDATGTAAVTEGLREGDEYVVSAVAVAEADDLEALRPGRAVQPASAPLPDGLDRLLDRYAPASEPPGARLAGVIAGLRADGYVSHGVGDDEPASRSGHSADRLTQLATDRPMLGDAEQYAAAAALLAREIGFPARVVMGFDPGDDAGAADGAVLVTGSDMSAWIEVQDADGTWLAIDPNPEPRPVPEAEPDEPTVVSRPQSVLPPPAERTPVERTVPEPEAADDTSDDGVGPLVEALLAILRVGGWALLGLALLASPFLAVIAAKLRRRRLRRSAAAPEDRVAGGWNEFADAATDHGYAVPASGTRSEQAAAVGGMQALVLASAVERSLFAPGGPDDAQADAVWGVVDEARTRIAARRGRWRRLRAAVSLSSFTREARGRRER